MFSIGIAGPHHAESKLLRKLCAMAARHLVSEVLDVIDKQVPTSKAGGTQIKHDVVKKQIARVVQAFRIPRDIEGFQTVVSAYLGSSASLAWTHA